MYNMTLRFWNLFFIYFKIFYCTFYQKKNIYIHLKFHCIYTIIKLNMYAFRTNLDLGGCVIRGLSVKVTEEVTGKFCISSGFTQGFILPITHSILHVVSIKLRIGKRMNDKHNV